MAACGVDFGTSNSAVALPSGQVLAIDPGAELPKMLRSVLFFPEAERRSYVGSEAIRLYLEEGDGRFIQSAKSWLPSSSFRSTQIRGSLVRLEELVAMILRKAREQGSEVAGRPLEDVVLGRPAMFSADPEADKLAETRLRGAAELAGFKSVRFLIEPIAAALAYEATLRHDETVLVGDFGAGTSDFTLMRLGPSHRHAADRRADVLGSMGSRIGGDNFDAAIMRHKLLPHFGAGSHYRLGGRRLSVPQHLFSKLLSWHEMSFIREKPTQELLETLVAHSERPREAAALYDLVMENLGYALFRAIEKVKVELSSRERAVLTFSEARVELSEAVTRAEFDDFCQPLLRDLDACVERLVSVSPGQRIDAVFLTGGTSYIPSVRGLFTARFGNERIRPQGTSDAFTSVAAGLGYSSERVS